MRLLLLLLVLIALWFLFLRLSTWLAGSAGPPATGRERQREPPGEELVRCAACGIHVPRSRALPASAPRTASYCSEMCRRRSGNGPPAA